MRRLFTAVFVIILSVSHPSASQNNADRTIVYIECDKGGQKSAGSGVLVSPQGHVLTAKHVVPDGSTCRGSVGVADPAKSLVIQPTASPVDAALLRFAGNDSYEFATYCSLEELAPRNRIFVVGFPGRTQTGAPSFRQGVLSTVFPNSKGVIETDGQTISGMSGGPVFSNNLKGFVGIVIGAQFDAGTGMVSYYGILPAAFLATHPGFTLIRATEPCYRANREAKLPPGIDTWSADKGPLRLGVRPGEGICFLSKVWGVFNDSQDRVSIEIVDNEYVLTGSNKSGGEHGAAARCIWLD